MPVATTRVKKRLGECELIGLTTELNGHTARPGSGCDLRLSVVTAKDGGQPKNGVHLAASFAEVRPYGQLLIVKNFVRVGATVTYRCNSAGNRFDSAIQRCAAHQLARQQGLLSTRDDNLRQCLGSATAAFNHGAVDVSRSDRFADFARGTGAKLQCSSATRRTMRCGGRGCPTAYVCSFSRPNTASRSLPRKLWASSFPKMSIRHATTPVHPV
ncbi:MAG: hypothetical protein QOF74_2343 [Caballeronia mineralivorans]|nr:hypothetical protein [Caballeronia mineralivorans]